MLFTSILALLFSNAVTIRRDKSILYARISILILFSCILISINSFNLEFEDKGLGLFGGLYHTTVVSHTFQIFVFLITLIILQLNSFYPRKILNNNYNSIFTLLSIKLRYFNNFILNKMSEQYRIIEYPLIILFVVLGGVFLMSSSDIISIFLSIELQSYGLYILCAMYRDSERATTGGLTYFLLGGLSSCFILLASSLLYGNSGNTGFDGLYVINNISGVNINLQEGSRAMFTSLYESSYINFSMTIMSIGFLFKISAAPFHFWSPDVYDAIPTIVTTFVAVFAKISILVLLLELVHYTGNAVTSNNLLSENYFANTSWTFTLLISSFLSLIIGSVLGLTQSRIKRLYAYSTISHIGFILLALTINSIESIQSFIFYLMQYSISNLNAFVLLIAIGYSLYLYIEKEDNIRNNEQDLILADKNADRNNSPVQLINDIKGLFYINPVLSLSLAITLFSFVGVPPLIGFFAKQMILTSAIDNGYVFMALIAILTSVISACYYLVLVKQIFFNKTDYTLNAELTQVIKDNREVSNNTIHLSSNLTTTISILTLIILFFMLSPQEWLNITTILSLIIFNC